MYEMGEDQKGKDKSELSIKEIPYREMHTCSAFYGCCQCATVGAVEGKRGYFIGHAIVSEDEGWTLGDGMTDHILANAYATLWAAAPDLKISLQEFVNHFDDSVSEELQAIIDKGKKAIERSVHYYCPKAAEEKEKLWAEKKVSKIEEHDKETGKTENGGSPLEYVDRVRAEICDEEYKEFIEWKKSKSKNRYSKQGDQN